MTTGKLDDKLTDRVRVKFTDYAINKFQGTEELFNKTKDKSISVRFENCGLKGLKLFQYKKSLKKFFVQQFWFDGKADHWSVGEFRPNIFGIKECQTKAVEIMKTHTDDNGMWIKNPKIIIAHK